MTMIISKQALFPVKKWQKKNNKTWLCSFFFGLIITFGILIETTSCYSTKAIKNNIQQTTTTTPTMKRINNNNASFEYVVGVSTSEGRGDEDIDTTEGDDTTSTSNNNKSLRKGNMTLLTGPSSRATSTKEKIITNNVATSILENVMLLVSSNIYNTEKDSKQQQQQQQQQQASTRRQRRRLAEDGENTTEESSPPLWEAIFVTIVLLLMFITLLTDRVGADWVMITALTLCMVSGIITIPEGLEGFSNEGVMTVVVLFVVAAGIAHTGALDWYMGKLLGKPRNISDAQVRLMIPMAFVSAFLNNTPVVVIMIPIVQRWGKSHGISTKQLLIPLSFSSILGGTCTLIGTSTNLVVYGLLQQDYPNVASQISIFSLGEYGIPIAFVGAIYILLLSQLLIPGGKLCNISKNSSDDGSIGLDGDTEVLLGARLTKWSSAAGRTVKRSGLRDTGGIYLVSVYRVTTGNVHRAVGQDFVLNAGDVLYFTGLIESFGQFCNEHSLEIITNELEHELIHTQQQQPSSQQETAEEKATQDTTTKNKKTTKSSSSSTSIPLVVNANTSSPLPLTNTIVSLQPIHEMESFDSSPDAAAPYPDLATTTNLSQPKRGGMLRRSISVGTTTLRLRLINRMTDLIHGRTDDTETMDLGVCDDLGKHSEDNYVKQGGDPPQIIVVRDSSPSSNRNFLQQGTSTTSTTLDDELILIGVNCVDRSGLLYDISRGITSMNLQCRHTEAAVIGIRSMSIWRCEATSKITKKNLLQNSNSTTTISDEEYITSVLKALLSNESGIQAVKERGISVIRAIVTKHSRLIGKTATELNFRDTYKAAIVAVKRGGSSGTDTKKTNSSSGTMTTQSLSSIRFQAGDLLVLQASDDSDLLKKPPIDFYKYSNKEPSSMNNAIGEEGGGTATSGSNNLSPSKKVSSVQDLVSLVTRGLPGTTSYHTSSTRQSDNVVVDVETGDNKSSSPLPLIDVGTVGDVNITTNSTLPKTEEDIEFEMELKRQEVREAIWKDLQVLHFNNDDDDNNNNNTSSGGGGHVREFLTAMQVSSNSALSKKSAVSSGLTKLSGVYLVSIERPYKPLPPQSQDGENHPPNTDGGSHGAPEVISISDTASVTSFTGNNKKSKVKTIAIDEPLESGDILWFAGSATSIGDLRKIPGLVSNERDEVAAIEEKVYDRRLVQAVVAKQSPLVGRTPAEVRFRTKYGAAVIAVHRDGKRLQEHPGRVKLQGGDVLLLEAGPTFIKKNTDNDKSFSLLSEVENSAPPRLRFLIPALLLTVLMIVVATAGVISLLLSALLVSILMVAFGILSQQEARDAINWDVYVTIASAFGLGTAMSNSGVSSALANFLVNLGNSIGIGSAGLFGSVYLATFLISNIVTNNAAAALIYPVAMEAAVLTGTDQVLMAYCIMLAASASFMSPFGYTTNLLIYGPGGYKFKDFLIFGTPMQLILWILTTALLSVSVVGWWLSWIVTGVLFIVVTVFMIAGGSICSLGGNQGMKCFNKNNKKKSTKDN